MTATLAELIDALQAERASHAAMVAKLDVAIDALRPELPDTPEAQPEARKWEVAPGLKGSKPTKCRWCPVTRPTPQGLSSHERTQHPAEYRQAKTGDDIPGKTVPAKVTPAAPVRIEPKRAAQATPAVARRPNPIEKSPYAGKGHMIPTGVHHKPDHVTARVAALAGVAETYEL